MRLPVVLLLIFSGSFLLPTAQAQVPVVQQLVDSVNIDSMVWHVLRLSGEVPVNVGNGDETIASRYQSNTGNALAEVWLQQQFTDLGYSPTVQVFGTSGANIIAEKLGVTHPERKVIICAHYDDMPGGPVNAPGADDNGSGVCAVLEAARIMSGLSFENTVVFALWDQEEQGSIGSAYYASVAGGNNVEITAAVNMDAIGYDGNGDGVLRIYTGPVANSEAIKDSALMVNDTYGLNLPVAINDPGSTFSDHASFWAEGYGAIMIGEDYNNDLNPHYHTPTDSLHYMDLGYWHGLARLAIGTAAVMAVPVDNISGNEPVQGDPSEYHLSVFPNPATTSLHCEGLLTAPIRLEIIDACGRSRMLDMPAGRQEWVVDIRDLPMGSYVIRAIGSSWMSIARFTRMP